MMKWTSYGLGLLVVLGLGRPLSAQVAPPTSPAAPTKNLWSFLCLSAEQKAACKTRFCNSAIGKLLSNAAKPLSMMSGGMMGGCCPTGPTAEELAKIKENPELAKEAEGAAAVIKKAEADAKARRAAVRYLGTVDCNWWPEAEDALIKGLRADTNECVRLEAAWALDRGCCCTKKTIEALKHSASSSKKDGYPAENSPRVKAAATAALSHCLSVYTEEVEPGKKMNGNDKKEPTLPEPTTPAAYYQWIETQPMSKIVADARRSMAVLSLSAQPTMATRQRPSGLVEIVSGAFASRPVEIVDHTPHGASMPIQKSPYTPKQPVIVSTPVETKDRQPLVGTPVPRPTQAQPAPTLVPISRQVELRPVSHQQVEPSRPAIVIPPPPRPVTIETPQRAPSALPAMPVQRSQAPAIPGTSQAVQGSAQQLMHMVAYGQSVDQRQQAAERLANSPWATHAEALQALVTAARQDAAPAMRATCVRCLARLNANHTTVMATLMTLKADADATVRHEASVALNYLSTLPGSTSTPQHSHQASWRQYPGSR